MGQRLKHETIPSPVTLPGNGNGNFLHEECLEQEQFEEDWRNEDHAKEDRTEEDRPEIVRPEEDHPETYRPEKNQPTSNGGRGLAAAELLWSRRSFLLKFAIRGLLLSLAIALLLPNYYRSTARLMPPTPDTGMSSLLAMSALSRAGGAGLASTAGNLLGIRSTGSLFIGILRARSVEDQVVNRFNLRKVYGKREMEGARKQLELNTEIAEDRLSGIITITVTDHDRYRAADLANSLVDELNTRLSEVNVSSAHKERVFIEDQLKVTKQALDEAAKNFSLFASQNTTIDIQEQGKAMVQAAARIQGELIASQSELKGLEQIYTPTTVHVRSLQARIHELENQLQKLDGARLDGAKNDSNSAGSEDAEAYPSIRKIPLLGVTYFDLFRQTKIQEAIYEVLSQQYEMAKVQEAKELPTAHVLDVPSIADRKSGPVRSSIILVGTLLAVACGMFWILAQERWNDFDPRDPRKRLVLEIYAVSSARAERIASSRPFAPVWALLRWIRRQKPESHQDQPV